MVKVVEKSSGYTLLELMLVLVIVTTLSVIGLSVYQQQARNFKIDKTSLQMQQWLQAGMSFYIDCNTWPSSSLTDSNILPAMTGLAALTTAECPVLTQPATKAYMPAGSDANGPWPNSYIIGPGADAYSQLFGVKTYVGIDSPQNQFISNSIAARLPNATAGVDSNNPNMKGDSDYVEAYVNIPGQAENAHGFILDMEMVNSKSTAQHITMPNAKSCPSNMQPVLVSAISGFESYEGGGNRLGAHDSSLNPSGTEEQNGFITQIPISSSDLIEPQLTTISTSNGSHPKTYSSGDNQVLLITACLPKPNASNSVNSAQPQNSLDRF